MAGGNLRLLHVNKIREYRVRVQTVGVIYDIDDEFGEIYETPTVSAAEKNDEALDRVTLDYLSKSNKLTKGSFTSTQDVVFWKNKKS
ncbi:hypothetical protein TNCV_2005071 [Trichonephila clavipes]|nr:hypothetical protein TNCV_2005071 [Trichonephila clavipes]